MSLIFSNKAWKQYTEWQAEDKKITKRINELIKSINRDGILEGIGKPEVLKLNKEFSRRINDEHRLVYKIDTDKNIIICSCKYHYGK